MNRRVLLKGNLAILLCPPVSVGFAAESYPDKPAKIICPFGPGGSGDITSRIFAEYFGSATGQTLVVENRAGANGSLGAAAARSAPPDGYTLLLSTNSVAIGNGLLFKSLPYDYEKDFNTVGVFSKAGAYMVVRSDHPASNLSEFIAYAKARPKQLSTAYFNLSSRVPAAMFKVRANVDLVEVPYKEVGQAANDLIGGRIDTMFMDTVAADSHIESKTMRALAITTGKRSEMLPDVPTLADYFPDFEFFGFSSLAVPIGTPTRVQQRLNQLVNEAIQVETIRSRMDSMGLVMEVMDLPMVEQFIRRERERWTDYIRQAGIEKQ